MAQRPVFSFRHADPEDLRANIERSLKSGQRPLVMSDGVFAARGRIAPVTEYVEVLREYAGATLLLDDAHALGVLGPNGRGTFEHACLYDKVNGEIAGSSLSAPCLLLCGTLSKAIGGYGGIIPGSRQVLEWLKKASHWYDGASAPPSPVAAATAGALELVIANPDLRARLRSNVRLLREGLRQMGLDVEDSPVPIACLVLGSADNMRRIQGGLQERGILTVYMAAYSGLGPEGALRLAVFATHTEAMIRELLDALRRLV